MSRTLLFALFLLTCATAKCPTMCRRVIGYYLDCSNTSLSEVPSDCFQDVFYVDLAFNNITTLKNDSFFVNYENKMETLVLRNNGLKTIEANAFRGLTQLKYLDLAQNNITTIIPIVFYDNIELTTLILNKNQNLKLPYSGFILQNLQSLSLKHCGLQHIPSEFFANMLGLNYIHLMGNKLSSFDPGLISHLSNLRLLGLSENKLTSLQCDLNQTIPHGVTVYFQGNPVPCDCVLEKSLRSCQEKNISLHLDLCGTPPLSIAYFLEDNCTNKPRSSAVESSQLPTVLLPKPPATSLSTPVYTPDTPVYTPDTPVYTPDTPVYTYTSSLEVEIDQEILHSESPDYISDRVSTGDGVVHTGSWASLIMWLVTLGASIAAMIIIVTIVVLFKMLKGLRDYTISYRFSTLKNNDDSQENTIY